VAIQPLLEEIQMMKDEKKAPILLTEAETDHVAGGTGNHFGQLGHPAWSINNGNAINAPGHNKPI
jgi:hypothetical protein